MSNVAKKERKIIDAACSLLAQGDAAAVRTTELVRRSRMARRTFYATYTGRDEVLRAAFEFSALRAIYAGRSGGLGELKKWAEANPDQVRTVLLAGPQINLNLYNGFVFKAADAICDFDAAVLDGALTVAAKHAREGRPIDGALIDELAEFYGHYA